MSTLKVARGVFKERGSHSVVTFGCHVRSLGRARAGRGGDRRSHLLVGGDDVDGADALGVEAEVLGVGLGHEDLEAL
eukprot:3379074-Pyramimonas_sp.AAC.2